MRTRLLTALLALACLGRGPAGAAPASPPWGLGPFTKADTANPVLTARDSVFDDPLRGTAVRWEHDEVFNPAAVVRNGRICLLYRAEDDSGEGVGKHTSRLGLASSADGLHFARRPTPVLFPANDAQKQYEWPGGCEDPRLVETADGGYVLTYTEWNRQTARLAVATSRDLAHWDKRGPAFAQAYGGKYAAQWSKSGSIVTRLAGDHLVAVRINGHFWMLWGEGTVYAATSDNLTDWTPVLDAEGHLVPVLRPRPGHFDSALAEAGPPAVLTKRGIVFLYNGKNDGAHGDPTLKPGAYSGGQALIDPHDPTHVLQRPDRCFLTPERPYEVTGQYAAGTVFIEGLAHFRHRWWLYYGTADSMVAVASAPDEQEAWFKTTGASQGARSGAQAYPAPKPIPRPILPCLTALCVLGYNTAGRPLEVGEMGAADDAAPLTPRLPPCLGGNKGRANERLSYILMKTESLSVLSARVVSRLLAALGTLLLLAFCTWGQLRLRDLTGAHRPYTIFFLIPVAIGAALLGVRGGVAAALVAVFLARAYLFDDQEHGTALFVSFPNRAAVVEFLALLAGTLTIAAITGRLRSTLGLLRASGEQLNQSNRRLEETNRRLEDSNARLVEMEEQRRVFHRDVLMAVTGGKLRLIEPEEMPPPDLVSGRPRLTLALNEPVDASHLRTRLQMLGQDMELEHDRLFDLCTGATEAATNAIKHGHGGEAQVWAASEAITVLIKDRGEGIAPAQLARATLEQGYSTRVSLGMGFHLMLQTSDVLALATSPQGTAILLRVLVGSRVSEEDALLARYVGL